MDERQAINLAIDEISKTLAAPGDTSTPQMISNILKPIIFDQENWNPVKAKVALLQLSKVLDAYLRSNGLGSIMLRPR